MRYLFTPKRFSELQSLVAELKKAANESAKRGFESGLEQDGHHDEGYQLSLRETAVNDRRVGDLEEVCRNAEITVPVEQSETVRFGNGVEIIYPNGEKLRYILEGYVLDFSKNYISINSPFGSAIIGAKKGEKRSFSAGGRTITVIVGEIFPPSRADELYDK
jgi:transcription elongation GreA/GreB family factor